MKILLGVFFCVLLYQQVSCAGNTTIYNVVDYGAVGDGVTDDTSAVVLAAKITVSNGGVLYFPSGSFLITSTINLVSSVAYEVAGDGFSSTVLWAFDGHLFSISPPPNNQAADIIFHNLHIQSAKVPKTTTNAAIYCVTCVRSLFQTLLIDGDSNDPGSGILMTDIADTNTVRDCQMWNIKGTGVEIGRGSEVRIMGGRIIGDASRNDGSIGVHVTGNNGGVHIDSTDIIALQTAVVLDSSNGAGSNREIFLTHATLDSCWRGLAVSDSSYISIVGCWAASCNQDNIWTDVGYSPTLVISGGTIFNAGVYTCTDPSSACNGITINSGTFILNGVEIRNNLGKGVWVPNGSVNQYVISGCRVFGNGIGMDLGGTSFLVSNNVCSGNANASSFGGSNNLVTNNLGC